MTRNHLAAAIAVAAARPAPHAGTALLQGDIERWKKVAQTAGIKAE